MAEEAFALSPISARPNVPGEADYDAIREAFMETARGRWFLNEYAKRNRHTDTGMVMEAVARIEASLKAQKQAPAALSLSDALGAIRSAVRHAKATAIESLPRPETDDTLTAARNGARIVREIAWTLRECGADTRICDLLDTQVKAIEAGQQGSLGVGRDAVLASYDLLMQRIEQLVDGSFAAPAAKEEAPLAPTEATTAEARASVTPLFKAPDAIIERPVSERPVTERPLSERPLSEQYVVEQSLPEPQPAAVQAEAPHPVVQQTLVPTVEMALAVAEAVAPISESTAEITATLAEVSFAENADKVAFVGAEPAGTENAGVETAAADADAHDLAVLDMVAMEMSVEDSGEPETAELDIAEQHTAEQDTAGPEIGRSKTLAPQAPPAQAAIAALREIAAHPLAEDAPLAEVAPVALAPEPEPAVPASPPSLGAALIASGVISNPNAPSGDPLAAIRRMTQAEKIAFFS